MPWAGNPDLIPDDPNAPIDELIPYLAAGGLLLYPTETVWGMGCDPTNGMAVRTLRQAKATPAGQPFTIALARPGDLAEHARLNSLARELIQTFMPGPLTLIVALNETSQSLWEAVAGPDRTIGLRCPSHPVTRDLLRLVGPLVSTSANYHGAPHIISREQLDEFSHSLGSSRGVMTRTLGGKPDPNGQPSTIIDITKVKPKVLRWGALGPEDLGGYLSG